ncbi:hypothetical protein OQA88_4414 [Cercophora sp. LCS_1]
MSSLTLEQQPTRADVARKRGALFPGIRDKKRRLQSRPGPREEQQEQRPSETVRSPNLPILAAREQSRPSPSLEDTPEDHANDPDDVDPAQPIFQDGKALVEHQRQTPVCVVIPRPQSFPGITSEQVTKLRVRAKPTQNEVQQWEEIWKMLFPGSSPPASVYIDPSLPEEVNNLKDYMAQHAPLKIMDLLKEVGVGTTVDDDEDGAETLQTKLSHLLLEVGDRWKAERQPSTLPHSPFVHTGSNRPMVRARSPAVASEHPGTIPNWRERVEGWHGEAALGRDEPNHSETSRVWASLRASAGLS